jgi:23S rRNA (uracil1939-C5)-methyltransferase
MNKKENSMAIYEGLKIIDLNSEGMGVAKIDGKAIFIDKVLQEEIVDCKIIADKKNYFLGEVLHIQKNSPHRTEPFCPIFHLCGGCNLQHLSYEEQLRYKNKIVLESLERIGKIDNFKLEKIIGMTEPRAYRNKGEFPIDSEQLQAGFYKKKSKTIVHTEVCGIQNPLSDRARNVFTNVYPYLSHLISRVSKENKLMLILVTEDLRFFNTIKTNTNSSIKQSFTDESFTAKSFTEKCSALQKAIPELTSLYLSYSPNASHSNGKDFIHLFGDAFLIDSIGSLSFEISPQSFFQTNHIQTEQLYKIVKQYASLSGNETVVDLYCGIGTIGLYLASHAQKIIGVESVKEAVENAKANAKRNSIPNAQFIHSRAEHALEKITEPIDLLIVDPPRAGLEEKLIKEIIKKNPKKIIYVSCNPASFSRDIKRLREKSSENYSLTKLQAIDMFPHTTHVETVVLITRKND